MAKEITINVRLNPCSLSSQFWTKDNPLKVSGLQIKEIRS